MGTAGVAVVGTAGAAIAGTAGADATLAPATRKGLVEALKRAIAPSRSAAANSMEARAAQASVNPWIRGLNGFQKTYGSTQAGPLAPTVEAIAAGDRAGQIGAGLAYGYAALKAMGILPEEDD